MPKGPSCRGCGLPLADSDLRAGRTTLHVRCSPTRRTDPGGKDAPSPAPVFRPPAPGTDLGGLLVLRDLGQGGMGTVVAARDLSLDRDVAVKFLNQGRPGDSKFLARVRREGRALARVEHPHVVRVYSVAAWEGWPFLVMEMVRGTPLSDVLARGTLPVDEALRLAEELAEALAAVHSQGITHRDVKPQNCILRRDGGSLCLIDFGLARGTETSMRSSSGAGGTIHYMAPEQLRNRKVDARADVYGFGVTLFECLTGRRTHEGDEPAILFQAILHEDAPLLRAVRPDAPRGLEVLLARALARSPEFRQADGRALVEQVKALRAGDGSGAAAAPPPAAPSVRAPPHDPAETYPLLGRGAEYRASLEALDAAAEGRGTLLLVEGGPGAGKTRFLREVERAARARGMEILRCECAEFAGAPHRAVRSMLLAAAAARGAVDPEAVVAPIRAGDTAGDLLAPALRWFLDPGNEETGQGPARSLLVRAVQALVRSFLSGRPALLVADDLHLLDEGSLDLLADVLEDSPSWPLATAASFRPAEGARQGAALAGRLPRLEALRGARRLVLGPLSEAAVATMAYRGLGMTEDEACHLAPALHRRSAGNPLFVVECLRMLEQEQAADHRVASVPASRRLTRLAIPPRLLELALHRVSHLPREEREALGAVSVEPAGLTAAVVARCLDLPPRAALRVLQELAQARGLLQTSGERYSIANAAIREAAYGSLLPELRRAYHDEAAKALQAAGAGTTDPSALGRHLRLAGRGGDAVAPLVEAGRRLLRCGSVAEALDRYHEALECAGPAGSAPAALGRAEALARSGDADGARAQYRAVADGKEGRVEALLRLALLERDRGEYESALGLLDQAAALPRDAEASLRLFIFRAQVLSKLQKFEEALGALKEAEALASQGTAQSRLRLSHTRGTVCWRMGRFQEAAQEWEKTLPMAEELGEIEMASMLLHNLSLVCTDLRQEEDAFNWATRAVERAKVLGLDPSLVSSLMRLIEVHLGALRVAEAEALLEEVELHLQRIENPPARAEATAIRARIRLLRGQAAEAHALVTAASAAASVRPPDRAAFQTLAAESLILLGRPAEAVAEARAARSIYEGLGQSREAEESLALAARAMRESGREGAEREVTRQLAAPRTLRGAIEAAMEAGDVTTRSRRMDQAKALARTAMEKAELESRLPAASDAPASASS